MPGDNEIAFTPEEAENFPYTCWMGMTSSTIQVVDQSAGVSRESNPVTDSLSDTTDNSTQDTGFTTAQIGISGGGCCVAGAGATDFFNGNISTDTIQNAGYSPAVLVLQKGAKTKINFIAEKLNSCNNIVVFSEYVGKLNLQKQSETQEFIPQKDFTFQCWMGMLNGYVKVVDDIHTINLDEIRSGCI